MPAHVAVGMGRTVVPGEARHGLSQRFGTGGPGGSAAATWDEVQFNSGDEEEDE